jgi:hypothetical protein
MIAHVQTERTQFAYNLSACMLHRANVESAVGPAFLTRDSEFVEEGQISTLTVMGHQTFSVAYIQLYAS